VSNFTPEEQQRINAALADGEAAKQLAENPYFRKLTEGLEKAYFSQWTNSRDPAEREKLHGMVCVLQDLKLNLQAALDNAKNANSIVEARNQRAEAEAKSGPLP
jgi:hypothetical protein